MDITQIYLIGGTALFRHGLRSYLPEESFRVDGEFDSVADCLAQSDESGAPDIVIVIGGAPESISGNAIRDIRGVFALARVLVLAPVLSVEEFSDCLAGGASGYLLSSIGPAAFGHSLKLIELGEKVFASDLSRAWAVGQLPRVVSKPPVNDLTDREVDILRCLAAGSSNKVIARQLEIAEATVKIHVKSLLRKIDVRNRTQAALWAIETGMASLPRSDEHQ